MPDAPDSLDPATLALLTQLWRAAATRQPWSLARLGKQSALRMSTLLRLLTALAAAGLVTVERREDGGGSAALTAAGRALCHELFGAQAAGRNNTGIDL